MAEASLAIKRELYSDPHPSIGAGLVGRGDIFVNMNRLVEAADDFENARRIFEARLGADHHLVGHAFARLGNVRQLGGANREARTLLERALELLSHPVRDREPRAVSQFALARALGRRSPRARQLAIQAEKEFAAANLAEKRTAVRAWLDRH